MTPCRGRLLHIAFAVPIAFFLARPSCADGATSPPPASDSLAVAEPCSDEVASAWAEAEPESPPSSPGIGTIALKDAGYVLGAPIRWNAKSWLTFGGAAAAVVAMGFALDVPARNKTQSHQTAALDDLTKVVEPFGQEYALAVMGAYGIAGFVFQDPDARDIAVDSAMASILASGIITPVLKEVTGRARPDAEQGSTSFHPFSGDTAFPSGHATEAFAVASVIAAHSDKVWVNVTAYTLAGLVGFSRIYHDRHWSSDVVAGALIGTAVGRGIVEFNRKLRTGDHQVQVGLAPVFGDRVRGLGVTVEY